MSANPRDNKPGDRHLSALTWGAAVLMVACCAVPALIGAGVAAGVLGTIGALLSSPSAIAAGVVLALLVIVLLVRKSLRPSTTVECCPPHPASPQTGATGEEAR